MNSKQEGSLVFGPLTNHRTVAVKCILGYHRYCQGAVLKTNRGGCQGASIISHKKKSPVHIHMVVLTLYCF